MLADYPMEQETSDNENAVDDDDDEEDDEEEEDEDMDGAKTRRQSDVDME
jgi:protein-serine/threonine kinase